MSAPTRTPRSRWIEAGQAALAGGGPDAVRVDGLARELGVTRGGFYWHFADRQAFLVELLDEWERRTTTDIIDEVEQAGGDPRARLRRTFAIAAGSEEPLRLDLAIRSWARIDPDVAGRVRRVDDRRMAYLRGLYATFCPDPVEVEVRCLLSFSLLIGDHVITAEHPGRTRAEVVEAALAHLGA